MSRPNCDADPGPAPVRKLDRRGNVDARRTVEHPLSNALVLSSENLGVRSAAA